MKKLCLIINLIFIIDVFGQTGSTGISDARSVGMAKTYTAVPNGVYSIGNNPANLLFNNDHHFEFSTVLPLPDINVLTGTDFLSIKDYNYFFGGVDDGQGNIVSRYLTETDKTRLKSIFEGGGFFVTDLKTSYFSALYKVNDEVGAFGIGINDVVSLKMNFPEQLISLALDGNTIGKIYNFNDAEMEGWWLRNYSLSYARDLKEIPQNIFKQISFGLTIKYVQGISYAGIDHLKSNLETGQSNELITHGDFLAYSAFSSNFNVKYDFDSTSNEGNKNFSPFPSPAGTGFGFDFGLAANLNDIWKFGIAVTDIGKVNWNKNVVSFSSNEAFYLSDITEKGVLDSLSASFTGKGEYITNISTSLPTALRLGLSLQVDKVTNFFPGTMLIALDYNQGFNNRPGNSTTPIVSFGAEWKPMNWIPFIRSGLSFGGNDGFDWAFGLGIKAGFLEFNFGSPDFKYVFMANTAKRISLSIGTRWVF